MSNVENDIDANIVRISFAKFETDVFRSRRRNNWISRRRWKRATFRYVVAALAFDTYAYAFAGKENIRRGLCATRRERERERERGQVASELQRRRFETLTPDAALARIIILQMIWNPFNSALPALSHSFDVFTLRWNNRRGRNFVRQFQTLIQRINGGVFSRTAWIIKLRRRCFLSLIQSGTPLMRARRGTDIEKSA